MKSCKLGSTDWPCCWAARQPFAWPPIFAWSSTRHTSPQWHFKTWCCFTESHNPPRVIIHGMGIQSEIVFRNRDEKLQFPYMCWLQPLAAWFLRRLIFSAYPAGGPKCPRDAVGTSLHFRCPDGAGPGSSTNLAGIKKYFLKPVPVSKGRGSLPPRARSTPARSIRPSHPRDSKS